jgi:PAS domain S-box-containing protein
MTWWFRISALIFIAAAVYGAHHIRMRVISHRNRMLEHEVSRRTAELQRMTERLDEERARLRMLLDGLPGIVFLQSLDGSIRYANRLFHETFGEPETLSCGKASGEKPSMCADCRRMAILRPGDDCGKGEWASPDGRVFEVYEYPFADSEEGGLFLRLVLDITDRKRAEKELLNREKVRAALATAGAATHELNQPLQIISGYCEILGEQLDHDDPNGHIIRKIEEQVLRMSEISKRMNKVIRYETKEYFNGMPILDIYKSSE